MFNTECPAWDSFLYGYLQEDKIPVGSILGFNRGKEIYFNILKLRINVGNESYNYISSLIHGSLFFLYLRYLSSIKIGH